MGVRNRDKTIAQRDHQAPRNQGNSCKNRDHETFLEERGTTSTATRSTGSWRSSANGLRLVSFLKTLCLGASNCIS